MAEPRVRGLLDGDGSYVENRPTKWQQTLGILNEYNPIDAFWRLYDSDMAKGGPITEDDIADGMTVAGMVTGGSALAPKPRNSLNMGIRAYHGSPHDFDKFSMDKIGTGEGAQAYGHGLYFAGNEDVARGYRERLAPPATASIGGQPIDRNFLRDVALDIGIEFPGQAVNTIQSRMKSADDVANYAEQLSGIDINQLRQKFPKVAQDVEVEKAIFDELVKRGLNIQRPNKGHMYEVDIDADPNAFLDWDKPLSEQPEAVQNMFPQDVYGHKYDRMYGSDIYDSFIDQIARARTGKTSVSSLAPSDRTGAVEVLREAGVPGIRYLDAGSRGAGDGTRNYVVFDDNLINILRKYGIAGLLGAGAAGNAMSDQPPEQY